MKKALLILTLMLMRYEYTAAQVKGANIIRQGNQLYYDGEMEKAEERYRASLEKGEGSFEGEFNLGDALYKQKKYEESAQLFKQLAERTEDKELKAKAYHNLGNSLLQAKQYQPSIEAYKNALRNNPADEDTRYNLSMAMRNLKQEEQKQDQQQDKDKQDQQQDEKKDQQKQDQQKEQEQKEKEQQEQQQKDQEQQQEQKQQPQQGQMSKEEAERMLDALNNEEKNLQQKLKQKMIKPNNKQIEKDW